LALLPRDDWAVSGSGRGWPYDPVAGPPSAPASASAIEGPARARAEAAPEPAISQKAIVLLVIAGSLALILASAGISDWWVRNAEMRTLLGKIEQAERAQLPAFQSISPLLLLCRQESALDDSEQCDTVTIRQTAERILPKLQQTGDEVAGTRLTSYHGKLRTFRDRYVDHYLAWRGWLETLAQDPTAGGFQSPDSINTTFEAASEAADRALTPLPLHGNRTRVQLIFEAVR
jgi:hypothetical protein